MNKRLFRLLALLLSAVTVVALAAPGTVAFMAVETPKLVNTFTADPYIGPDVPPEPGTAIVPVKVTKTIRSTGKETISPKGFSFLLENLDTGEKLAFAASEKGIAAANLVVSAQMERYRFRLTELNTGVPKVTYSKVQYDIEIIPLVDAQGQVVPRIAINGSPATEISVAFENLYDSGKLPHTGDRAHTLLYAALLAASAAGLVLMRRRRQA